MSDVPKLFEDELKGTTLPALLARFVEAYECSPNRTAYVLRFKHLLGRESQAPKQVNNRTSEALASSIAASSKEIYDKTLHSPSLYLSVYEGLLEDWYRGNRGFFEDELTEDEVVFRDSNYELTDEEREARGELFDNPYFRSSLEKQAEDFEKNPDLKRAFAREFGYKEEIPAFDLLIRMHQKTENDSESSHFDYVKRSKPDLRWSKELIGRLGDIVEREVGLEAHPFASVGELVPIAHRTLFEQAHMLYLFDFDIPCVLTCGTLVEELVEKEFPDLSNIWSQMHLPIEERRHISWESKIQDVVSMYPKYSSAKPFLENIVDNRNVAAHDPSAYLSNGRKRSESILRMTRNVLEIFFELANSQVEGN
jgi:hypothetical protein